MECVCPRRDVCDLIPERSKLLHANLNPRLRLVGQRIVECIGAQGKEWKKIPHERIAVHTDIEGVSAPGSR